MSALIIFHLWNATPMESISNFQKLGGEGSLTRKLENYKSRKFTVLLGNYMLYIQLYGSIQLCVPTIKINKIIQKLIGNRVYDWNCILVEHFSSTY